MRNIYTNTILQFNCAINSRKKTKKSKIKSKKIIIEKKSQSHIVCLVVTTMSVQTFRKFCMREKSEAFAMQTNILINAFVHNSINEEMQIFFQYFEFFRAFNKIDVNKFFEHVFHDLAINTQDVNSSFDSIYNLFVNELKILRNYLNEQLIKRFIISSSLFVEALILFVKKKNEDLRLCVDYRELNVIIVKNRYSLPFINEAFDKIMKIKYYIKLNIINGK